MITIAIMIGIIGYIAVIFGVVILSLIISIWTKDWDMFIKDLGAFIVLNAALAFGLAIGTFIFGNLLNWMMEGQFTIQVFDSNKVGFILLAISFVMYIVGSPLKNRNNDDKYKKEIEEERKHKYITLKTGQRVQLY